ncbi:MAG: hypothetical protein AAFR91_08925 [Pseudomonadota bacterium]
MTVSLVGREKYEQRLGVYIEDILFTVHAFNLRVFGYSDEPNALAFVPQLQRFLAEVVEAIVFGR